MRKITTVEKFLSRAPLLKMPFQGSGLVAACALMAASAVPAAAQQVQPSQTTLTGGIETQLAAAVQNTGDAKANHLAANILRDSTFKAVSVNGAGGARNLMGLEVRPASNGKKPDYTHGKFHTQLRVFIPAGGIGTLKPPSRDEVARHMAANSTPLTGYPWNTPASLACVYNLQPAGPLAPSLPGCVPDSSVTNPSGGAGAIAVVDAFDTPATTSDLQGFSAQFGLRQANFQIVYATGQQPESSYYAEDQGWDLEAELDVQWAHAMAPYAKIFLVEAASDSDEDLYQAVDVATNLLLANGGGEVSMSWGGSEDISELAQDAHFSTKPGIVYLASAGDTHDVYYPATSPNVIAVGGTSILRDNSNAFQGEVVWDDPADESGTGGGPSYFEPRPNYQASVASVVQSSRGVPDVSYDADSATGVWVLAYGYWNIVGGTSLGSPATAGVINAAASLAGTTVSDTTQAELIDIYRNIASPSATATFRDITSGSCGSEVFPPSTVVNLSATPGYDLCTGIGTPLGYVGFGATPGAKPKPQLPYIELGAGIGGTLSLTPVSVPTK